VVASIANGGEEVREGGREGGGKPRHTSIRPFTHESLSLLPFFPPSLPPSLLPSPPPARLPPPLADLPSA